MDLLDNNALQDLALLLLNDLALLLLEGVGVHMGVFGVDARTGAFEEVCGAQAHFNSLLLSKTVDIFFDFVE